MAKSIDKNLKKLSLGSIRPSGWLLNEMQHLSNLQKRLGALQGLVKNGEWVSGESLPRYVRGLTLLAAALDDKTLKDKVSTFVNPILNSAREGGDFGPKQFRSLTPKIEAIKALLSYWELTGDERILPFIKKYFKYQFNTYNVTSCWYDSRARLLEEISALEVLYRETDLEWLQDLGEKLRDSSIDWFKLASSFNYKKPYHKYVSAHALKRVTRTVTAYSKIGDENPKKPYTSELVEKEWKKSAHRIAVETNGVNLAKAVKYPAIYGRFVGDDELKKLSLKLINALTKYHGTPMGMFACDRRIAGTDGARGVDVEASVEMIESLVEVIKETGSYECCDLLERIVFNLIPASSFEDCSAVQDMMHTNQVEASIERRLPYSDEEYASAYLTKKVSRGAVAVLSAYPTYMQAACMVKNDEINLLTYTPCTMDINIEGAHLTISEKTGYPFRNTVVFKVEKAVGEPEVKINFRVPKNTTMQLVSGGQVVASGTKQISVKCILKTGSTFMLKMGIPLVAEENVDGTYSLFKGNVLMSLKLPTEISVDKTDRRILGVSFAKKWNITPVLTRKGTGGLRHVYEQERTIVNEMGDNTFSFDNPPFELKIRSKNVINWDYDVNGFTQIPKKCSFSEESLERTYIPFGCSLVHMAKFPKCFK